MKLNPCLRGCLYLALLAVVGFGCSPSSDDSPPTAVNDQADPAAEPTVVLNRSASPVVILGFDGVDPRWVREWIAEGDLPNLAGLSKIGGVRDLESTCPPQSPVSWSTFTTGMGPGGHRIFDFLLRDPKRYIPIVSSGKFTKPSLNEDGSLHEHASWEEYRAGRSFWKILDDNGLETLSLAMAYDFPPAALKHGSETAGLGAPDIRGTNSFFTAYATDRKAEDVPGGKIVPVSLTGDTAESTLEGLRYQVGKSTKMSVLPIRFTRALAAKTLAVAIGDQEQTIPVGGWSDWYRLRFPLSESVHVKSICKVYVESIDPELRVYVSPRNMDPNEPLLPFATPEDFVSRLVEKHGLFKTIGWIHDTNALRAKALGEDAFLADAFFGMDCRKEALLDVLNHNPPPLLLATFTATDRISHMFYRFVDPEHPLYDAEQAKVYGGSIRESYRRMDAVVGDVLERLDPGARLMIVSDHGFHPYRYSFSVNTWLIEHGYMILKGQRDADDLEGARRRMGNVRYLQGIDWGRTRAYGVGLGQIYINLTGREGRGTVAPGQEYDSIVQEIRAALLAETDPKTGAAIITNTATRDEAFQGPYYDIAPDIQIGYAPGYQTSKDSASGGAPKDILAPNLDAWSGDHACSDWTKTQGFLMTNFKLDVEKPGIIDVAPTILTHFGMTPPDSMEGEAWTITE